MLQARCPVSECGNVIDFSGKPIQFDDGDFYTVDGICDGCGASVQGTVEVASVVVIS